VLKDGTVRTSRTAAARAAAGLVAGQAWTVSDEEALLVPEWTGAGAFAAALVAALTFAWLLMRWRRSRARSALACRPGAWRPWSGPGLRKPAPRCAARGRQRPLHRRRSC
jgi:hypothetical protein